MTEANSLENYIEQLATTAREMPSGEYKIKIKPGSVVPIRRDDNGVTKERGASAVLIVTEGEFSGKEFSYTFKDRSAFGSKAERDCLTLVQLAKACSIKGVTSADGLLNAVGRELHTNQKAISIRVIVGKDSAGRPDYSIAGVLSGSGEALGSSATNPPEPTQKATVRPPEPIAQKAVANNDDPFEGVEPLPATSADDEEDDEEGADAADIF